MSEMLDLNDVTSRIRRYVSYIKARKNEQTSSVNKSTEDFFIPYNNDVQSNINPLNGESKFSIQTLNTGSNMASSGYAAEAYEHLSAIENRHKVVIDFMHKNNRNFDVKA